MDRPYWTRPPDTQPLNLGLHPLRTFTPAWFKPSLQDDPPTQLVACLRMPLPGLYF